MGLYCAFVDLPLANSLTEFAAAPISSHRRDFLAKASDGAPLFLLHDSSTAQYTPAISLKNISVQFHATCRVTTLTGTVEDQFAVIKCDASVPDLYELFVRCVASAVERLPTTAGTNDIESCVRELVALFLALSRPNNKEVTGLWGELFVLSLCSDVRTALAAWHSGPFERFDFSWRTGFLEVKSTTNEMRVHDFSLEQLRAPIKAQGYVASLLLQPLTGGIGVMDLARKVEVLVQNEPLLKQKLWENVAAALGADFSDRLDRRFDPSYAERNLKIYRVDEIPAPDEPKDSRITAIRFRVDLTTVPITITGVPAAILTQLFN